jgi:hypothetical protein
VPVPFPASLPLPATGRQIAQFVASRAAACVGADYSNLALVAADERSLRVYHSPFLGDALVDKYSDIPLEAPYPIAAAARTGEVILLADLAAYGERFPDLIADTVAAGVQATASLPLYRSDGELLGALGFAWSEPTPLHPKLQGALHAVARLCVETVERAERFDADHRFILELQRSLLNELPTFAGLEAYARYLSAGSDSSIGGDWYEGLALPDGRVAFVVGDVTGHGLTAAADMSLVRGMIGALLHAGVPAPRVFSEVASVLAQRSTLLLASAALAIIDVTSGTLTFATAGHPPPLLRLPGGEVEALGTANGPLIGVSGAHGGAETVKFPPGAFLVLYTDGLVEHRRRSYDVGVEQATAYLLTMPESVTAASVAEALIEQLLGDRPHEDDVVVLVVGSTL